MRLIILLGVLHATLMVMVYYFVAQHPIYISSLLVLSLLATFLLLQKQYKRHQIILKKPVITH